MGLAKTALLSLSLYFVLLLATPILSLFFLLRLLVILLTKLLHLDYAGAIEGLDAFFLVDNMYERPHFSVTCYFILRGQVNSRHFNEEFLDTFILQNTPTSNGYAYNRLQQFPELFCGFYFWRWDRKFDLNHHIHYYNGNDEEIDESNLNGFMATNIRSPYREQSPLWEIRIISNFGGNLSRTLVLFKFHHGIVDGKSLLSTILQNGFMKSPTVSGTEYVPRTIGGGGGGGGVQGRSWLKWLASTGAQMLDAPVRCLNDLRSIHESNSILQAKKERQQSGGVGAGEWVVGSTAKFNMSPFVAIKNSLGVTLSSLFLSGLAGGLSKYLAKYFQPEEIPKEIMFLNPFPIPGHPVDRLANHFSMSAVKVSLEPMSLAERIELMNNNFLSGTTSPFVPAGFYGLRFLGLLPSFLLQKLSKFGNYTANFSNVIAPKEECNLFGYPVEDIQIALCLPGDIPALTFILPSYKGEFRIFITADKSLIPDQVRMNELSSLISAEFERILSHFQRKS